MANDIEISWEIDADMPQPDVIEFVVEGPPGEQGVPGAPGEPGPAVEPLVHTQAVPSALWHVLHNRGYRPLVSVFDAAGEEVIAGVTHTDMNQLYIEFTLPALGSAVLI